MLSCQIENSFLMLARLCPILDVVNTLISEHLQSMIDEAIQSRKNNMPRSSTKI